MPVIMGRKTFEVVNKPLPGRFNIVITRQTELAGRGRDSICQIWMMLYKKQRKQTVRKFLLLAVAKFLNKVWILADKIYLTPVHAKLKVILFFR